MGRGCHSQPSTKHRVEENKPVSVCREVDNALAIRNFADEGRKLYEYFMATL